MRAGYLMLVVCIAAGGAHAQVFKCRDALGRTIYSDTGCTGNQSGALLQRSRSLEEQIREREQAYAAQRAKEKRLALAQAREREAAEQEALRASMHRPAPAHEGYAERLAQRNAGVKSAVSGSASASRGLTRAQRESALSQAHTPQARRDAMREASTVLPGAQGLTASQRDAAARLHAAQPGQAIGPSSLDPRQYDARPKPTTMTHCAGGFCHDNQGGVYHQHGNGLTMTGPSGTTCVSSGAAVHC